ncbi:YuiB family protein [Paenibacillus abyssi]|uniref:Membrane protein YuiB n=1 Tax=Paenibacillus abyssi TaxID=1340531 RepID=A0A917CTU7_9BACL|nr:YuiB family protein [Paenibacillus abyssi]GGF96920.1 putative membrane protein YuiB [Paenibacillus abyssi]
MLQMLIAMMLFFVMMFGVGFILNMLLKTTWFPVYLFFIVVLPLGIYYTWDDSLSFVGNFTAYTFVDIITVIAALIGAVVSGYTMRALRRGGYRMF